MKKSDSLSENLEDYLETILELEQSNKVARAKDIADKLGVKRASVTGALKSLEEKGLVNYEPYSFITLTTEGQEIAERVTRNHEILKKFFTEVLQIDEDVSDETACRMEHAINENSIDRLVSFIDSIQKCPRTGNDWLKLITGCCGQSIPDQKICLECIETCREKVLLRK